MARKSAMQMGVQTIPIPFPSLGVDDNAPFDLQRSGTTPIAFNVRPYDGATGRRRGGRREGYSKFIDDFLEEGESVQNIIAVALPRGAAVGTGDVLTVGTDADKVLIFPTDGGGGVATFASASLSGPSTIGKFDEDNNGYVASYASGNIQVSRIPANHTTETTLGSGSYPQAWQNINIAPGTSYRLCGMVASGGIVYVFAAGTAVSAIYRLHSTTGELVDSGAWMTHSDGLPVVSLGNGTTNMMAVSSGLLGVLGTVSPNNLVCAMVNIETKTITQAPALSVGYGPFNGFLQHLNICADYGANFYVAVLTSDDGVTNFHSRLHRVHWDGTLVTKTDSASPAATVKGIYDVSFDPNGNGGLGLLGVVGLAINGTTNSFQNLTPETLVTVGGYQPESRTTWARIAADGLGSYVLRRAAANTDVAKITPSLYTTADDEWHYDSSENTVGWIASTSVVPAALSGTGSLRAVRLLNVVNGNLYRADSGYPDLISEGFCAAASNATAFAPATTVFSTILNFTVFYADGSDYPTYNYASNITSDLDTAIAAGSNSSHPAPKDTNGRRCRLIETWGGRLVLARLDSDPSKWFMSAIGDATNWNYGATPGADIAASQTNALALQPGDIINGMIPLGDNILIFLCQGSIWRLTGNPMDGGVLTQVSDTIGGAFGRAWCKDPQGNAYFMGSDKALYRMTPDGAPQRVSTAIDTSRLSLIDLNVVNISMLWNDRFRGINIWITPYDETVATTHYWWDSDTPAKATFQIIKTPGSWWPDVCGNLNHNPLAVYSYATDDASGRVTLIGTRDGRLLFIDGDAISDDGTAIDSEVWIGPIHDKEGNQFTITDLRTIMGEDSSDVSWEIYTGASVEAALAADPWNHEPGTFTAGRNRSQAIRASGHILFVRLFSSLKRPVWVVDSMKADLQVSQGIVPKRQF